MNQYEFDTSRKDWANQEEITWKKKYLCVRHGIQICGGNWQSLRVCVCVFSLAEGFLVNQILWCCQVFSTNNRIRASNWRKSMRNCIVYIRFACNFRCLISNYEFVCARKIEWSKCIWQMPDHVNPIYSNEAQTSVQFFDGTLTFIRNTISILFWFGADLVNVVVSCVCHHFYDAYALLLLLECFFLFCQTTCIFSRLVSVPAGKCSAIRWASQFWNSLIRNRNRSLVCDSTALLREYILFDAYCFHYVFCSAFSMALIKYSSGFSIVLISAIDIFRKWTLYFCHHGKPHTHIHFKFQMRCELENIVFLIQ